MDSKGQSCSGLGKQKDVTMLAALGYGHYLFIPSFIILLNSVCTWHGLNAEELPTCIALLDFSIFSLSLPFPPPSYCSLMSASITYPLCEQNFSVFYQRTKYSVAPNPRCPTCHVVSFCFVCICFRLFFSIKTHFLSLSHFPWNLPHIFINAEKK